MRSKKSEPIEQQILFFFCVIAHLINISIFVMISSTLLESLLINSIFRINTRSGINECSIVIIMENYRNHFEWRFFSDCETAAIDLDCMCSPQIPRFEFMSILTPFFLEFCVFSFLKSKVQYSEAWLMAVELQLLELILKICILLCHKSSSIAYLQ